MIVSDKWNKVMDYLRQKKTVTIQEIMDKFNMSKSTVRRGLIELEELKLVKRTRGGVEIIEKEVDFSITLKEAFEKNKEGKIKIAKLAASLIKDNDFVFIDSGSTCYYMIDYITAKDVTIVTNGILHIQKLFEKGINTYVLGGYAKPSDNIILGEDTEKKISMMNFDTCFLGTIGIDAEKGFTTVVSFDGEIKKAVIKASHKCYVLADSSKFNLRKFYSYGELTEATVITDRKVDFDSDKINIIYAE
ncbi:DeoR family transcriptional regulator [Clostridium zeae]|uniref:DeoR family transcriptional regulator n=1 Tax=Clostridium zeae TaxID=2759022 RepID=A0ABQ1E5Z3_9CLOT|nr:DeoR/GlpR family DNA-binding transcription regulator [Clostridium zeae]GFZ30149.1 DeoR family transcriptional regulator [Clostridium zeae]